MSILCINLGSTSGKISSFDSKALRRVSQNDFTFSKKSTLAQKQRLLQQKLTGFGDVKIVVHRFVHGGTDFVHPVILNNTILRQLSKFDFLAPLHNPINRLGVEVAQNIFPNVKHLAVFDTEFHHTIPQLHKTYALPSSLRNKFLIHKYGFHGLSHQGVVNVIAKRLKKSAHTLNILSFHLGGGSSVTAIRKGKSLATTMGFSPNSGLLMMSRPGDIDSAIPLLLQKSGYSPEKIERIFNEESGIFAIAGTTNFRELLTRVAARNPEAQLAYQLYIESIRKYAAYYATFFTHIDALGFTGAIGAGSARVRSAIRAITPLRSIRMFAIPSQEANVMAQLGKSALEKLSRI